MDVKRFQAVYYAARLLHPKVKVSARIPMAIARQETSMGLKGVGVSCNNLFGMNKPDVRKTMAIGANAGGLAIFNTQEASILDFILFLEQLGLYTDDLLYSYIKRLVYNKNAAYPGYIDKILVLQAPDLIPAAKFYAAGAAALGGAACAVKLATVVIKKLV